MSAHNKDLVFLVLQFLNEEKFKETFHKLEQECGFFFNMKHFEDMVTNGKWEELEKYLTGFTKVDDNEYSMKLFFQIRMQKYLEALDERDQAKAFDIVVKDLKYFAAFNEELLKEITRLLFLENLRDHEQLSNYGDTKSARGNLLVEMNKLIKANPLLRDKLQFPTLENSRLRNLINQSFNWQHLVCENPKPAIEIKTLFVDHSCGQPNGARAPSPVTNPLIGAVPMPAGLPPLTPRGPFQPTPAVLPLPHPSASAGPMSLNTANNTAMRKHPRTSYPYNPAMYDQTTNSEHVRKRAKIFGSAEENRDSESLVHVNPRITESVEKTRIWKPTEISDPSQCSSLQLPDNLTAQRVSGLVYTNSGLGILALASNALHKLWKWPKNEQNLTAKATINIVPQLWQPASGILMTNDISDVKSEDVVPCFALSNNGSYVISASGGKISLFNMVTFETMATFMSPPPAATSLAFYPQDNNILAIGMDDSSVQIYDARADQVKTELKGHQKRVTGLAFSNIRNVLVSSGADCQVCVWSTDGWEKQASKFLQVPEGGSVAPLADTRVQFHSNQTHFLAIHETQIAMFKAPKLDYLKQWVPPRSCGPITYATYSCDSSSIYVSFEDGIVDVLTASTFKLRCRVHPSAYSLSNPRLRRVYPVVIAAHPSDGNQFAVGLSDGEVHVIEPLESDGGWCASLAIQN